MSVFVKFYKNHAGGLWGRLLHYTQPDHSTNEYASYIEIGQRLLANVVSTDIRQTRTDKEVLAVINHSVVF